MTFKEQVVWITGASSGIGEALAYTLSRRGARLILSARREERLEAVRDACERPGDHLVLPLDLTAVETLPAASQRALDHFGRIDAVVHNGGIGQRAPVRDTELAVVRRIMDVNFFGAVALTCAVLPHMRTRNAGRFVVITSLTGKFGTPGRSAYAASKHALHGFFDSLRAEEHGAGIRVHLVCPGYVRTAFTYHALHGDGTAHDQMGRAHAQAMSPDTCAEAVVRAVEREKDEAYVGGKERLGVYIKRLSPALFNRLIRRVPVT